MANRIRMLRAMDGILYCSVLLVLLLLHPSAGRDLFGGYDLLCALPAFALAWFVMGVPPDLVSSDTWRWNVHKLRICAVLVAGTSPMAIWWSHRPDDPYLLINFTLFVCSAAAMVFFLSRAYEIACVDFEMTPLVWESKLTRYMTFWLLNVGGVSMVLLILLLSWHLPGQPAPGDNLALMIGLNYGGILFMQSQTTAVVTALVLMAPTVFFLSLTLRLRLALKKQIVSNAKE